MNADRIEVYCNSVKHPKKHWRIGTFERHASDAQWRIDDYVVGGGKKQTLIGNRQLPQVLLTDDPYVLDSARIRYPLRCDRCRQSVPISEGTEAMRKLQSWLDECWLFGVSEVSLSELRANVQ